MGKTVRKLLQNSTTTGKKMGTEYTVFEENKFQLVIN